LDEPFSGLDPIGIKDLKDLIKEFKLQGKTVFINSHILLEMEQLCDSFAVLKNGKLVHSGSVASMKEKHGNLEDFFTKLVMES
jgi:ABC-type multidrug transport system ATPase subunit